MLQSVLQSTAESICQQVCLPKASGSAAAMSQLFDEPPKIAAPCIVSVTMAGVLAFNIRMGETITAHDGSLLGQSHNLASGGRCQARGSGLVACRRVPLTSGVLWSASCSSQEGCRLRSHWTGIHHAPWLAWYWFERSAISVSYFDGSEPVMRVMAKVF